MIGIYKIENKENKMVYIGQSINIEKRWSNHRSCAFNQNSKDYNIPLYRDFRKYGIDKFNFEVIEECLKDELDIKEQYWIEYFNSFYNGYNESFGGKIHCRYSNISKRKVIGVIDDLKTTNMTHKDIAEKWDVSVEMVQGINTGRYWNHNTSYPIQTSNNVDTYKKTYTYKCKTCNNYFNTEDKYQIYCSHKCSSLARRKVKRPSKEKLLELIKTTSFLQIGKMYGVSDNAVRRWCKSYDIPFKKKEIKSLLN